MAVVLAQLVERPLSIPEVSGSNPVIGKKLYIEHWFIFNCIEKKKIKEERGREWPIYKMFCKIQ